MRYRLPTLMAVLLALPCIARAQSSSATGTEPLDFSSGRASPEVPFVPTPEKTVEAMLALGRVGPGDVVYDLGCGDGRIVIAAARKGARAVGVDIDPVRIKEANENARKAGVQDRVEFRRGDLFEADIRDATVVTLYLLSSVNERLKPKLLGELGPGTRIVSQTFGMGSWKPDETVEVGRTTVYLWTVPRDGGRTTGPPSR